MFILLLLLHIINEDLLDRDASILYIIHPSKPPAKSELDGLIGRDCDGVGDSKNKKLI